ncbi:hypothetical protein F2Q69_00058834 [Brassica cretica]|uniref:Uncharacterized protein n=1 Tax=Brassica cretica TaxID=69181 RepID=A0A8S9RSG1_BRACR|nr:hypothetical protein F2Q69_00058834 [Brassica cretica]
MAAQHRSTEHHKYRSPLNCVGRYSHQWQPSTDETMSLSVDSTSSTTFDCHFIVSIDTEQDFLDVDCNIAEVMILSFKSCEYLLFSNLFQRDCPSVLLEDKQKDFMSVLLKSGQSASREKDAEEMKDCQSMKQHWLGEKGETPSESSWNSLDFLDVDCNIAEVMILSFKSCESLLFSNLFQRDCPSVLLEDKQKNFMSVLLKSGQSASREKDVEEMKDCQSMKQH